MHLDLFYRILITTIFKIRRRTAHMAKDDRIADLNNMKFYIKVKRRGLGKSIIK